MPADKELVLGTKFVADVKEFLPVLRTVRSQINQFATALKQFQVSMSALDKDFKKVAKQTEDYTKYTRSAGSELSSFQKMMGNASNESRMYRRAMGELEAVYGKGTTALKLMKSNLDKVEKATQKRVAQLRTSTKLGERANAAAERLNNTFDRARAVIRGQVGIEKDLTKARAEGTRRTENQRIANTKLLDSQSRVNQEITIYQKELGAVANRTKEYQQAHARLRDSYPKTAEGLKEVRRQLDAVEKSAMRRAASIRNNNRLGAAANEIADRFIKNLNLDSIARIRNEVAQRKQAGTSKKILEDRKEHLKRLEQQRKEAERLRNIQKGLTEELSAYQKELGRTAERTRQYREAHARLREDYPKTAEGLKLVRSQLDAVEKSALKRAATIRANTKLGQRANVIADQFLENLQLDTIARMKNAIAAKKQGGVIDKNTKQVNNLTKAQKGLHGMIGKIDMALERFFMSLKSFAAYGAAAGAIYALTNAFAAGKDEIIQYDQAMKNIQAITNATDLEMRSLGEVIREVAVDTKFSTGEIAKGVVLLGQAGFTAAESMNMVRGITELATATLANMAMTTDLVTSTVRAFNISSAETGRVVDVMANAINRSKLTIDKLRIAFNFVGAAAAQSGLTLEQTAASMMVLANNGIRASTIGTGLRQVLSRMLAPNRRLREAFEEHSISLDKINPKMAGFEAALAALVPTIWDNEKGVVDMGKAYQLFGLRGAQAVAIIAKSIMSGEYSKALQRTYEFGTANRMAEKQLEGLAASIKNLIDRMKVLALGLGDAGITGALRVLIGFARALTESLINATRDGIGAFIKEMIVFEGLIIAVAIPVVYLTTKIWGLVKAYGGLKMALLTLANKALLINPYILAAVAVGGLLVAMRNLAGAQEAAANEAGRLAVENMRVAESLQSYIGSLNKADEEAKKIGGSTAYYISIVKRLAEEHEKLAEKVDLATLSHEELIEVLEREIIAKEGRALEKYTERLEINVSMLKKAWNEHKLLVKHYGLEDASLAKLIKTEEKFKTIYAEMTESLKGYASVLVKGIQNRRLAIEVGEERINQLLKEMKIGGEAAEAVKKWFKERVNAVVTIMDLQERMTKETIKDMEKMPSFMQGVFDRLDGIRRVDFVKAYQQMQNKVAAYKNTAKLIEETELEIEEGIRNIQENMLREFSDYLKKKENKDIDSLIKRYGITERHLQDMSDLEMNKLEKLFLKKEVSQEDYNKKAAEIEVKLKEKIIKIRKKLQEEVEIIGDKEVNKVEEIKRKKIEAEVDYAKAKIALLRASQEDEEKVRDIALKKHEINLKDELFEVEKYLDLEVYSKEQAEIKKAELDKDYKEIVLEIRKDFLAEAKKHMKTDVENYQKALLEKLEAEQAFYGAEKKFKELRDRMSKERADKEIEEMERVEDSFNKMKVTLAETITVDIDTSPAVAALDHLVEKYQSAIAGMMAAQVEFEASTMGAPSYGYLGKMIIGETYRKGITALEIKLSNIKSIFKDVYGTVSSAVGTSSVVEGQQSTSPPLKEYGEGGYVEDKGIAEKGEFVMIPAAVTKFGRSLFETLNNMARGLVAPKAMNLKKRSSEGSGLLNLKSLSALSVGTQGGLKPAVTGPSANYDTTYKNYFTINESNSPRMTAREIDKLLTKNAKYNRSAFSNYFKSNTGRGGM